MNIKTKFGVNDLLVGKYQRSPFAERSKSESLICFEVMDVNTQTCMAGTQVFYVCRPIHGLIKNEYVDGEFVVSFVNLAVGATTRGEYGTFREDELVAASNEVIELVRPL